LALDDNSAHDTITVEEGTPEVAAGATLAVLDELNIDDDEDDETADEDDEVDGSRRHSIYANFDVIPMEQFQLIDSPTTDDDKRSSDAGANRNKCADQ
jgi:hypothetical protein